MTYLEIHERQDGAWLRLLPIGELDLGTAPVLKHRLEELRAQARFVRLDLSGLGFISSSGIDLLIDALNGARADDWRLGVDARLSRQSGSPGFNVSLRTIS